MSQQEDRIKAMRFAHPEYIPISLGLLPATWAKYGEALRPIMERHPVLFGERTAGIDVYAQAQGTYTAGEHVDIWGCVWSNVHEGMEAIVTGHPLPRREMIRTLQPPASVTGHLPHGFMFLRLTDLRGFEEAMLDFAEEPEELQLLIDIVLQHNLKELEVILTRPFPDGIVGFGDDLGMQTSLPMRPAIWRKYLKPCYMAMYQRVHAAGYAVYMHTDGHILDIIPDLIDCGVNVINPQFRANGLENLKAVCKGKVCVNLDLDRQMFPFVTPAEIDAHVRLAVETMGDPAGGLWLTAECAPDVPLENIDAIATALETYRGYYR